MASLTIYQVDAFTDTLFGGNPAAVILLDAFLVDAVLLNIAIENNLSETAYIVQTKEEGHFQLRWFTPGGEVDLCGHATLASAFVIFDCLGFVEDTITFETKSGPLTVTRLSKGKYIMDFPADHGVEIELPDHIENALGVKVEKVYQGKDDYLAIINDVYYLRVMKPDMRFVESLGRRGLIVSAKSDQVDFESRCFYPNYGIDEDPVTGSAHTLLTPYWSIKHNKNVLNAIQASPRKGHLTCIYKGDRVALIGEAVLFLEGEVWV